MKNTNKISMFAGALFGSLLVTTALTPAQGADMTFDRVLDGLPVSITSTSPAGLGPFRARLLMLRLRLIEIS